MMSNRWRCFHHSTNHHKNIIETIIENLCKVFSLVVPWLLRPNLISTFRNNQNEGRIKITRTNLFSLILLLLLLEFVNTIARFQHLLPPWLETLLFSGHSFINFKITLTSAHLCNTSQSVYVQTANQKWVLFDHSIDDDPQAYRQGLPRVTSYTERFWPMDEQEADISASGVLLWTFWFFFLLRWKVLETIVRDMNPRSTLALYSEKKQRTNFLQPLYKSTGVN